MTQLINQATLTRTLLIPKVDERLWKPWDPLVVKGMTLAKRWIHRLTEQTTVIRSLSTFENGEKWLHVSVAREDRLPTWEELKKVKNDFIGEDVAACQMLPKPMDYVNCHSNCLHLWAPLHEPISSLPNLRKLTNEEAI